MYTRDTGPLGRAHSIEVDRKNAERLKKTQNRRLTKAEFKFLVQQERGVAQ